MAESERPAEFPRLRIVRRFAAPPELVFDAFVEPALARPWLFTSPDTDLAARRVETDARVGGAWLMTNPTGDTVVEGVGEYLEIDRPRRLVFTFAIPQFSEHTDRIVVELAPDGDGCVLGLTHELLPPEYHAATESGWIGMFDRLTESLASHRGEDAR